MMNMNSNNNNDKQRAPQEVENVQVTVTGDGCCGKTSLLLAYANGGWVNTPYVPTVFDNYSANVQHNGETLSLGLWDTGGREDYDRLRPLSYPATDVFLVCFSVESATSFVNVTTKWLPELRHHAKGVPMILVGTKSDLREDTAVLEKLRARNSDFVTVKAAEKLAQEIGAEAYIECSALTNTNVKQVFDKALEVASSSAQIAKKKKRARSCELL